jgi:alkylation response protein AidB-like acyl-CoA dehydrogenase
VLTEVGRADASAGVLFSMNYALPFSATLDRDQAAPFLSDRLALTSVILPGPGFAGEISPLFHGRSVLARVRRTDAGAVLNGRTMRPLAGGFMADQYAAVCTDDDGRTCLALVPGSAKGIVKGPALLTTGLNACTNCDITFENVQIHAGNVFSTPGIAEALSSWLSLFLGGVSLGAGLNLFEILSTWCETRVIKGSGLLKENPLCAAVLADVAEELAVTKLLLGNLADILSSAGGRQDTARMFAYAGMIGARVQQSVMKAINRGLELMGSAGYAKEWHAEKHWRDVKTIQSLLCGMGAEAPTKMDTARFFFACSQI